MLSWTVVARVVLGVALQIALLLATRNRDFSSARSYTMLSILAGLITSALVAFSLAGYLRAPARLRSGTAIGYALAAVTAGALLDLYSGGAALELFDLANQASRATTFWGMPSLSRMEDLQAALTWGGRLALLLGITAAAAVIRSLRVTAQGIGATTLAEAAGRTLALALFTGAGAVAVSFASTHVRAVEVLLVIVAVLLFFALVSLVAWLGLVSGVARALTDAGAQSKTSEGGPSSA
jgi:hypothetical protein